MRKGNLYDKKNLLVVRKIPNYKHAVKDCIVVMQFI